MLIISASGQTRQRTVPWQQTNEIQTKASAHTYTHTIIIGLRPPSANKQKNTNETILHTGRKCTSAKAPSPPQHKSTDRIILIASVSIFQSIRHTKSSPGSGQPVQCSPGRKLARESYEKKTHTHTHTAVTHITNLPVNHARSHGDAIVAVRSHRSCPAGGLS